MVYTFPVGGTTGQDNYKLVPDVSTGHIVAFCLGYKTKVSVGCWIFT